MSGFTLLISKLYTCFSLVVVKMTLSCPRMDDHAWGHNHTRSHAWGHWELCCSRTRLWPGRIWKHSQTEEEPRGKPWPRGTTGGRSALKQKTALCLGNPSGGGECTQCRWLSTGPLTYRTNHFSAAFSSHRFLRYLVFSGDHLQLGFTITKVRASQQRPLQVQITVRQAKKNLVDGSWDSTPFLSCQSKGKEPSFTGDSHRRRSLGPTLIAWGGLQK